MNSLGTTKTNPATLYEAAGLLYELTSFLL